MFSNEEGLIYRDMIVYPNNSVYRGQMKKIDETNKKLVDDGTSSYNNYRMSNKQSNETEEN